MTESQCQPVLSTAEDIAFEVMGEIQLKGLTEPDAVELFRLLQTPHMLVRSLSSLGNPVAGCCGRLCVCVNMLLQTPHMLVRNLSSWGIL